MLKSHNLLMHITLFPSFTTAFCVNDQSCDLGLGVRLMMHAIVNMEFSELVGNIWSHHNLPALQSVFTLPGDSSL